MATTEFTRLLSAYHPNWMDDPRVKCLGLGDFMYPSQPSSEVAKAKTVCNGTNGDDGCFYRNVCRDYAIDNHEMHGVWGGTSERDRRKIQRARKKFDNESIYNLEDVRFPEITLVKKRPITFIHKRAS